MKSANEDKEKKKSKSSNYYKWPLTVAIVAFILSFVFSYLSNTAITNIDIIPGLILLVIVVLLGIVFDLIGTAVPLAKEEKIHAMATKKIKGSKTAIFLIKNSEKFSNICCDVVGDICGVVSGAIGTMIALEIINRFESSWYITFVITALVSSVTITGKAITKGIAKKHATDIISSFSKIFHFKG